MVASEVKSRLKSAPATDEDSEIWLGIVAGYMEDWATVGVIFRDSDRYDAEIMLNAQNHPIICATYTPDGERIEVRGWHTTIRRAGVKL